jgi:hypothetical protein
VATLAGERALRLLGAGAQLLADDAVAARTLQVAPVLGRVEAGVDHPDHPAQLRGPQILLDLPGSAPARRRCRARSRPGSRVEAATAEQAGQDLDEASDGVAIELVLTAEVVEDLDTGAAGLGVPLVVSELGGSGPRSRRDQGDP